MPTIITHPVVPIAISMGLGQKIIPGRLLAVGIVVSILPDLDMLAFHYGLPYAHEFGHRGASHSLAFCAMLALTAMAFSRFLNSAPLITFCFVFAAAVSHVLLDMITNGGLGVALYWPLSHERLLFPVQVIEAAPLRLERFLGEPGLGVLKSEFFWVWIPAFCTAGLLAGLRHGLIFLKKLM